MDASERVEERRHLATAFRKQARFAHDYAPLYECLFSTVGDWLGAAGAADPLLDWLLAVSAARDPFTTTNLLVAALHRELLCGNAAAAPLRRYYPTLDGAFSAADCDTVAGLLREVLWDCRAEMAPFIAAATIQTNETSRGLIWRLPLTALPWPAVHLIDMGASAGLNLLADQRIYDLVSRSGEPLTRCGTAGEPAQFTTICAGRTDPLPLLTRRPLPRLVSRTGIDVAPFALDAPGAAETLMAYVWGDHPQRMARLREAIALLGAHPSSQPALAAVQLPDGLDAFLAGLPPSWGRTVPVVLYNSYLTPYLAEKGFTLRRRLDRWARGRQVAWFQLEPRPGAPEFGWCSWTVDLWDGSAYRALRLGWAHPHLTHAQFTDGLARLLRIGAAL